MTAVTGTASPSVDDLDRQILHALLIDGRAPFARLAEALGVSEQTVARRFRRLQAEGLVQVQVGHNAAVVGQLDWMIRVQCRPDGLEAVTDALARGPDTGWLSVTSGGSEVVCTLRPPLDAAADSSAVLLDRLPRSSAVLAMRAAVILRIFEGDRGEWTAFSPGLPDGAAELLATRRGYPVPPPVPDDDVLRPNDLPLLAELARDGRISHRALATATGWSESRVARRVAELFEHGAIDLDVDVSVGALGFRTFAYLWITVPPGRVEATGWALAAVPQVAFVAAVTGAQPLVASVVCRTPDELYRVVTGDVGGLEGVSAVEVAPVARRVKHAGALLDRDRLVRSRMR